MGDVKLRQRIRGDALHLQWLRLGVEIIAILLTVEAGTGLVDAFEFTVTLDLSIGIGGLERAE